MTTLISASREHLNYLDLDAMIAERHGTGEEITDSAALTIASLWQTSGGPGAAFAQLASTGTVDYHALQAAIAAEYDEAKRQGPEVAREFDALATWAMNHPSRQLDRGAARVARKPDPTAPDQIGHDRFRSSLAERSCAGVGLRRGAARSEG